MRLTAQTQLRAVVDTLRRRRAERLAVRYERRANIFLALHTLGCAFICRNQIRRFC